MDCLGYHVFTCPCFPCYKDRGIGMGQYRHEFKYFLHLRTVAQNILCPAKIMTFLVKRLRG